MIRINTELRDYQQAATDELLAGVDEGHIRQVYGGPCGVGKTEIAGALMAIAINENLLLPGTRPYFIVERRTLAFQARDRFEKLGLNTGLLLGEDSTPRTFNEDVMVASIQSLKSRYSQFPDDLGMGILDECHIHHKNHTELIEALNAIPFIGLSATPLRVGIGNIYSRIVKGPSVEKMIADNWLVPTRCFGPSTPDLSGVATTAGDYNISQSAKVMMSITGDVVSTWQELGEDRQTIAFCVNIAHATELCDQFQSEGITAAVIHHKTPQDEIDSLIADFDGGAVRVLCSVTKLAVGFDSPAASCAILARPTRSEMLHQQMTGRPMRLYPGKSNALILDHAGNIERFGPPDEFLMPESLDKGELDERAQRLKRKMKEYRTCPECSFMVHRAIRECPSCGYTIIRPCMVEVLPGYLVDLNTDEGQRIKDECDEIAAKQRFLGELKQIGIDRNYKPTWAAVNFKKRYGSYPKFDVLPCEPSGLTMRWVGQQQRRWSNSRKQMRG